MLLGTGTYRGAPFPKHAVLPIEKEHFERWLSCSSPPSIALLRTESRGAKGRALSTPIRLRGEWACCRRIPCCYSALKTDEQEPAPFSRILQATYGPL
jgi:hypothetical protein